MGEKRLFSKLKCTDQNPTGSGMIYVHIHVSLESAEIIQKTSEKKEIHTVTILVDVQQKVSK